MKTLVVPAGVRGAGIVIHAFVVGDAGQAPIATFVAMVDIHARWIALHTVAGKADFRAVAEKLVGAQGAIGHEQIRRAGRAVPSTELGWITGRRHELTLRSCG